MKFCSNFPLCLSPVLPILIISVYSNPSPRSLTLIPLKTFPGMLEIARLVQELDASNTLFILTPWPALTWSPTSREAEGVGPTEAAPRRAWGRRADGIAAGRKECWHELHRCIGGRTRVKGCTVSQGANRCSSERRLVKIWRNWGQSNKMIKSLLEIFF